jgi:hypothetical protein
MLFNSLLTFWIDFVNLDTEAFDAQNPDQPRAATK